MTVRQAKSGDAAGRHVIVVGAGVSGCACAATLAKAGVAVTLLAPALDHVGEPSFGPIVSRGPEGRRMEAKVLGGLPQSVREAWVGATLRSRDGTLGVVDRRLLSILVKQALEGDDGLELRQGLAVDVGMACGGGGSEPRSGTPGVSQERGSVYVETAFGERLEGDAAVVAVGLGVGNLVCIGESESGGGYGCLSASGLEVSLRALGAVMVRREVEVGPRWGMREMERARSFHDEETGPAMPGEATGWWGGGALTLERAESSRSLGPSVALSPYGCEELWRRLAWTDFDGAESGRVVVPDGLATGEVALMGGGEPGAGEEQCGGAEVWTERKSVLDGHFPRSREGFVVKGLATVNLDEGGRLTGAQGRSLPLWITGRAGGAEDYLGSLESGMRTGASVASALVSGELDER